MKKIIFTIVIVLICLFLNIHLNKIQINNTNSLFINKLLKGSNSHLVYEEQDNNIIYDFINVINDIKIDKPITIIEKMFKSSNNEEKIEVQEFSYIQNIVVDKPRVYIYSTHPSEKYKDDKTVVMASLFLQEKLHSLGIQTIVEERNVDVYKKENNVQNDAYGYTTSRMFVTEALNKNNFDLIIDLHRDSVASNVSTTTQINGKDYAKIMFVGSASYIDNYNLANRISKQVVNKYSNLSRGIYSARPDHYNQDLNNKMILLELGSTHNTFEEIKNTIEILAEAIKETLDER